MIHIYTDGSCLGNPGPGGWGAVIVEKNNTIEICGKEIDTTNNIMEISAVIMRLEYTKEHERIKIFSDSQYVINTMTKNWKRKANLDLWEKLDKLVSKREVLWEWVRGHEGNFYNEKAHNLAYKSSMNI